MDLSKYKIAILGGGNIGGALAQGLVVGKKINAENMSVTRRRVDKLNNLAKLGISTSSDNAKIVQNANIVVLAVLPQQLNALLCEIKDKLNSKQLIISLASGVSINELKHVLKDELNIVRAMPNTAIAIGESMTCITGTELKDISVTITQELFSTVGETILIHENQMTSATALCACGIAFFLRAIRAASQGGVEIDFHAIDALKMAAQTAKGAASLLLNNHSHPEEEIDKVTSPKGCTIAGLNQMEHYGFSSAFIRGIVTSAEKSGLLYDES